MRYAELQTTSNFTFLTGASHPEELVVQASAHGHAAVAITDRNTLAGAVRAHTAAKEHGMRFIVGCRVELADPPGLSFLVYPTDLASYGRLCRLLTLGKRRAEKGSCRLTLSDLAEHSGGLLGVVIPPRVPDDTAAAALRGVLDAFPDGDRLSVAITRRYDQDDNARLRSVAVLASDLRLPLVATNDVYYHTPERRQLQDVLTCIRHGCTIREAGLRLAANAERHLKPPGEMRRLFAACPAAIARGLEIVDRTAGFSLDALRYDYPSEVVPAGTTPMEHLAALTWAGAEKRYPGGVPAKVRALIGHELRLIEDLKYAHYFLTVHDLVAFAESQGILCQGRGAAANSAVCYCLRVTSVDPDRINMLFERFVSKERDEPPDIDIDFEHERREEVIQYLYRKFGRDRAALTAEVICYRGRLSVREVGKAMGLSLDLVDRLAKEASVWDAAPPDPNRLRELGLDPADGYLGKVLALAGELTGFPRHLSQHVGGFVITQSPLSELVPIENAAMPDRTVIEWDKNDIDALGMLKVDVLGLGMLTCIRKCFDLVAGHGGEGHGLATIPPDDDAVYDMICKADTVGVFQIESRAQMSMLPRLRPRTYYDLVIETAIVRPGPIQGNMVHPYLKRRSGLEPVTYASPEIERVLGRTLGVPLFQEQAMALAIEAAGFTPGEADRLRRAMAAWGRGGAAILKFREKILAGMAAKGYTEEYAGRIFEMISGFSGYGFPESHAASFALLVYASAWLKRHHPAAFAAALLNSQPMGFYQPAQIVRDAREHGVEVRPVDVNHSRWDCTLEPAGGTLAIRLGMRLVKGFPEADADRIAAARRAGPFRGIAALRHATGLRAAALLRLAQADAFGSIGLTRQRAAWEVGVFRDTPLPLFDSCRDEADGAGASALPPTRPVREVARDYGTVGLSLKGHPMAFYRADLEQRGVIPSARLTNPAVSPAGRRVAVAGLVLLRQRPQTASGIVFMTLEDETGTANLIVRPDVFERFRRAARHAGAIICRGRVERQGEVVHVLAQRIEAISGDTAVRSRDFR